jgi:hypothetical protein
MSRRQGREHDTQTLDEGLHRSDRDDDKDHRVDDEHRIPGDCGEPFIHEGHPRRDPSAVTSIADAVYSLARRGLSTDLPAEVTGVRTRIGWERSVEAPTSIVISEKWPHFSNMIMCQDK